MTDVHLVGTPVAWFKAETPSPPLVGSGGGCRMECDNAWVQPELRFSRPQTGKQFREIFLGPMAMPAL
jgi:hypothetical protein